MIIVSYTQWLRRYPDELDRDCRACRGKGECLCVQCGGFGEREGKGCYDCDATGYAECDACCGSADDSHQRYCDLVKRETALYNQWQGVKCNDLNIQPNDN